MVTGGFRSAAGIAAALAGGAIDLVGLARPLAVEPALAGQLFADPDYRIDWPAPSTGSKAVDQLVFLSITWYEHQLARIGKGQRPLPRMSAWRSVLGTLCSLGAAAFAKRRA